MQELYNKLITKIDKERVLLNEPMKNHTTFKVGGPADIFVKINDTEELKFLLMLAKQKNVPTTVIGNGSNVLVKDKGIRGIVVKLNLNKIIKEDETTFKVEAGVLLSKLARTAYEEELTGVEFACGIPASLGGAIFMNAGAYGEQIGDKIIETTYIDENLNIKTIKNIEHEFSYRKSIFQKKNWIIINSKIKLEKGNKEEIKKKMEEFSLRRKTKQPINMPSAGSTFKRGNGFVTAELIDKCGLKGYSKGDAEVSSLHAGFIINKGSATAKDIIELIKYIKQQVKEKFDVDIEPEIQILGED